MATAPSNTLSLKLVVWCSAWFVCCPCPNCQPSATERVVQMTERTSIVQLGTKSKCAECRSDTARLSPDGTYLALLHTDFDPAVIEDEGSNTVEIRDANSSRLLATFKMPRSADAGLEGREWQSLDRLKYCDQGRLVLACSKLGKVYVLDTHTYQPHAVIDFNTSRIRSMLKLNPSDKILFDVSCASNGNIAAFQIRPNDTRLSYGAT